MTAIFSVTYRDTNVTGAKSGKPFDYYNNGYKTFEMPIKLSEMLEADVGDTDLDKEDRFFDKLLQFGGEYEPYQKTIFSDMDSAQFSYVKYDDETVFVYYEIKGTKGSEQNTYMMQEHVNVKVELFQTPDGKTDIKEFTLDLPTASAELSKGDMTDEEFKAKYKPIFLDLSKKQAMYAFGLDESLFKDMPQESCTYPKVKIKVFGQELEAKMSFEVGTDLAGQFKSYILTTWSKPLW